MNFVTLKNEYYENQKIPTYPLACICIPFSLWSNPIDGLLERICPGASHKFIIQLQKVKTTFSNLTRKAIKSSSEETIT